MYVHYVNCVFSDMNIHMLLNSTLGNERIMFKMEGRKLAGKKSDKLQGAQQWRGKSMHNLN